MTSFERELESELHRLLDPMTAGQVPPRKMVRRSGAGLKRLLGGAGAALGAKVATGFAVAAMAATAAAAATEVATTGSLSPIDWGQHLRQQLATTQHGAAPAAPHQASPARANEHGGEPGDAAAKPKETNEGSPSGGNNDNSNKSHDDSSDKDNKPAPGTSNDREPTDPPMTRHIWLPPPPP